MNSHSCSECYKQGTLGVKRTSMISHQVWFCLTSLHHQFHWTFSYFAHTACRTQGRTGSSNRPWLSRQTGPVSSGVNRNSGEGRWLHKYPSTALAKGPLSHSTPSFPVLCNFVPRSLLSPPTFDVASHVDGRPTGPPGGPVRSWSYAVHKTEFYADTIS